MPALHRKLVFLALGAVLAAPAAWAGDGNPASDTTKPKATASRDDAVSKQTTARETGRMKESPVHPGQPVGASDNSPPGKGNWWAAADIDGDGKLSLAEAKSQAGLESRFGSIDANADGQVDTDEYRKFYTSEASQGEQNARAHSAVVTRDVWLKLDANSDGKLSASEVASNSSISGAFAVMDGNGDGLVTQAEYSAYSKARP